jgi:hypothetical protein
MHELYCKLDFVERDRTLHLVCHGSFSENPASGCRPRHFGFGHADRCVIRIADAVGRARTSMSAEPAGEFAMQTFAYAFDSSAGTKKREASLKLLKRLWDYGDECLSAQVLQKFFVTCRSVST